MIINDSIKSDNNILVVTNVVQGKGKEKLVVSHTLCSDESSDEEAGPLLPRVSPPPGPAKEKIVGATRSAPLIQSPPPI